MLLADVNVFVQALRIDSPTHEAARTWLTEVLERDEDFGVSELVLSGVVRIVTNHRVYRVPTSPAVALGFCAQVLAAPAAVPLRPGPEHFAIFVRLCREVGARANVVPDAYHAALAIEHNATWVTDDRGFARFPGLKTMPLPA